MQNPKYVQTVQANYRAHGRSGDAFDTLSGFRDYFCVSDEDKQDMTQGVGNMIADTKARLAGQQRYNKLKQHQDKHRDGLGFGVKKPLFFGVKTPFTNANVVREPLTGRYLTSDGAEYAQEFEAVRAQNHIDETGKRYTEAVERGDLPSAFEVRDKDGNYALVEDLGVKPGVHVTEKGKQQQLAGLVNTRKNVEEQYNALYRKLEEDFKRSAPFSLNTHSQYGIDDNDMRLQAYLNSNAQYRRLKAQLHQLDNAIGVGKEAVKGRAEERYVKNAKGMLGYAYRDLKSFGASALRGLWNAVSDVSTWDLGLQDLQDNMTLYTTVKKARQKGYENLNSEERQMLDVAAKTGAYTAENQQYLGRGYKAGNVTGESLPFMVEMALNPASGLGEAVMSKYMRNAIAKYGKEAVRKAAWKYVTKKCGYRIAGDVLGAALMTGTTGSARTLADTYDRLTGDIKSTYDSNGKIVYDGTENEEKGILKAYLKAFGATAIENHSEFVGEYFNPLLKGVGTLTMKGWKKVNAKSASAFLDNLKDMGSTSTAKWLGNLFDKTQWHGTIGEYAEEVVGNIENALLVGDSTLDTKEGTGVFNLDQNIDTFLGVSLMGGFFSTLKTGAYVRDKVKGERKILMQQSLDLDNSIRYALGADPRLADKWKEWRVALAQGTDEEKKQALKEISENTNGYIKKAMYDYSANAQKLAGMDKATQGAIEDGTITPEQAQRDADIEQAHEEGLAAEGTARHDIQQEHQLRENSLARMLGISAEQLDRMEDEEIESMTGQNDALDTAIYDYQTSRERYQGVIDRATDEVEQAGIDAAHQIDLYTDHSTGQIRPCVIKGSNGKEDYQGYIVNGNIATHPDGAIDVSGSDKMILYFDPETGKIEHGDASTFASLGESADATVARQQAIDEAKQQAAQAQSRDIDGGVEEGSLFNIADAQDADQEYRNAASFDIGQVVNAETGEVIPVSFEGLAEGENAYLTGGRPDGKTKDRLKVTIVDAEGNVTNRVMKRGNVQTDGRMSAEDFRNAYEEAVSSRMAPEADINEQENNVNEESVVAGGDKNGNPIYDKMPISATVADLYDGALDDAEIDGFVSAQIAEAEKAVEKMEKKKPKVGTDKAKYLADKKAWEEGLQEAQRKVQYWQDVKAEVERITTPEDARGYEEELNGDAAQTAYRNGSDAAAYGVREVTAEFMQSGDVKITPESYRKETGFGAAEQRAMVGKISKGGKSIDRLAEDLEVFDRENYNGMYFGGDSSVAKDAILDYLSSPDSRKGVKKMQSEAEREYVEAYEAERDRYYQEKYHMSYEEYLVYSSQEMPELLRKYSNFDEQQFYNLYAEEIEADLERREKQLKHINNGKEGNVSAGEESGHGRGYQVQSGERTDDTGRGEVGKDSAGEVGPRHEGVVESEAALGSGGSTNQQRIGRVQKETRADVADQTMTHDEAIAFIAAMENRAEVAPSVDLSIENWDSLFGLDGIVNTPIGKVKMGDNQFTKMMREDRHGKLGMVKPTLENPDAILEDASKAKAGDTEERPSSYIFVKAFKKSDGSRYYYFTSITVSKDGLEVVVSNQEKRKNAIANLLSKDNLVWKHADDVSDASDVAQGLYSSQGNVSDLATEGTDAPQTSMSNNILSDTDKNDIVWPEPTVGSNANTDTAEVADSPTGEVTKGETVNRGGNSSQPISSGSKDTNNTDTKQENEEKSAGGEKEPMSPTPAMIDRMIAEQRVDDVSELLISSELKKAAEGIAEAFGMKVVYLKKVFIKSDDPAVEDFEGNGFVRNGVIYLSLKEADIAQFTFGHELLHQLKQIDADSYMRIRQKVIDVMGRKAFEMEVKARQMTYTNVPGYTLYEDYAEEVIADTLGDIITHTDMLPNIARSLKENPSLLDRFLKVVDNVRQYFRGKIGGALGDLVNDIRNTYEMTARQGAERDKFSLRLAEAKNNTDKNPSQAQKESGNYRKGHIRFGGYNYTIENPQGSYRSGVDENGKKWKQKMNNTYGYILGTKGKDGDHLDMFINDKADLDSWNGNVYVVDQVLPDGSFDEHKVMYGFDSEEEARKAYLSNYEQGWQGLGNITGVSKEDFDRWLEKSGRKTKAFSEYKNVKSESAESPKTGAFGTIYTQFKGKPQEAIAFLLEKKEGEAVGALHHKDIGDIDLVWGKEGTAKSDGFGLAKLAKYHPEVLGNLQEILDAMVVVKRTDNRVQLESETHQASVRLTWDSEKKNWLLTAFEKKNSVSDNTTDTVGTAEGGKRNDTATPQNTVSDGKDTIKPSYSQKKNVKSNKKTPFSLKNDRTLAGVHNITEEKLRKALKLGGFANPSVAVIDTSKNGHEKFGEISLIAPSALVDKESGRTAGTWTTDAYTQRYPSVERQMSDKGYEKFCKWVDGLDFTDSEKAEIKRQATDALEDNREPAWELMYLKEKGIDIKAYSSDVNYAWEPVVETYGSVDDVLKAMESDAELDEKVRKLVKAEIASPVMNTIRNKVRHQIREETGKVPSPVNPAVRKRVREIFDNEYAPKLFDENGQVKSEDVRKVVGEMLVKYNDTKRFSFQKAKSKASTYVHNNGMYTDYLRWQEEKLEDYGTKGRIFRGYRNDGTRRYSPETLENVSKAMSEDADGETNGSEYTSFGSFIAKLAPHVDSTEEMRSSKDKLSSSEEEKKEFYDKWEDTYYALAKELYNDVFYGEKRLHDIVLQKDPKRYAKKEYGITLSASFMKNLDALKKAIREDLKSPYFETKFERPVHLDEFAAAVVPNDLGADVRKMLEESGIALYGYDPAKKGDRSRAFNEAINSSDNIRFSLRQEPAPKVTKKGYAVFIYKKLKNGGYKLVPKMLSNDPGAPAQTWLNADTGYMKRDENGEPLQNTNGRASVSVNGSQAGGNKSNKLAWRPGKHLAMYPNASQFKSPDGTIPKDVIFFEVEYAADPDLHKQYQRNAWELGMNDNGQYRNNQGGLPYIPKDSYYLYRTNSISEGATPMIITGAYKISRALTDAEAKELNQNAGGMWCPRKGGDLTEEKLKDMGLDDKGLKKMTESFDMDTIKESHDESDEARLLPGYKSREINWEDKDLIHSIEENGQDINDYRDGYVAPEHSEEPTIRFSLDKDKGTVVSPSKPSKAEAVLRDAVIDRLRENGMEVITDVAEGQKVLDEANGKGKLQMGDAPETFAERQKLAVENRGVVMPGLNETYVEVVKDIPRHGYTGTIAEATKQAIQKAKEKYVPEGKVKVLHYDNNGAEFDYVISGNAIEICLSPKHQAKSGNKGVHLALAEHLDEVINKSVEVEEHPDYIKGKDGKRGEYINPNAIMHRFYGVAIIDGVPCRIMTLMREDARSEESNGIHSYEVQKIEMLDNELPSISNGVGTQINELSAYPLAKLLKGVEKAYDKGKYLLEESKKRSAGLREQRVFHGSGADGVRFFRTANGEAYGFTVGGRIYVDPRIATSETPVHEYAHLWATALRSGNAEEWQNVVGLMKDSKVWDEVKKRYPELKTDDEIADEVNATYSGQRGAERLREEQRKIAEGDGGVFEKAEAISALEHVKRALKMFWKGVADFLHIHYKSAEEVADRVMKDLLEGVDPRKMGDGVDRQLYASLGVSRALGEEAGEGEPRYQFIGEKGAAEADHAEEVSVRLDNLSVAREMEAEKKDAKAIKMATGWERGADGKWRYEIADMKEFDRNGNLLYRKHHPDYARYIELQDKDLKNLLEDGEELTDKEREEYESLSKKYESDKFGGEKLDNIHTLEAYVDAPELFKAYPELRNVRVTFKDTGGWETASYYAISDVIDFDVDDVGEIVVNTGKVTANMRTKELKSVMLHEIQHAIQVIEGFAEGGSPQYMKGLYSDYFLQDYSSSQLHELAELRRIAEGKVKRGEYKRMSYAVKNVIKGAKEHGFYPNWAESFDNNPNSVTTVYDTLVKFPSEILDKAVLIDEKDLYRRVAGEVEARNVQERMGMSAEERRASLAAETEDVAREDQIFLMGNGVSEMGSRVGKRMAEIGEHYEDRALTDEERPIVDVFCGRNDNLKVSIERDGKSLVLMMRQGSENGAGTKHCLYRHYGTGVGYLTADDILKIPYIMANGFAKEKLRGKSRLVEYTYKDEQGCEYTLLTEKKKGFEIFNDFYTNRKASSLSTFNTSEDAHTGSDNALIGAKLGNVSETAKESEGKDRQRYASLGVSRQFGEEVGEGEPRWASLGLSEQQLDGDDTIRFSLNYDKWDREMASWLKRNRLPKNAQRPVVPQREAGESDLHFAGRLAKYNQDKALWNTAPKYEGHLSSGMTARGEFNYELQRGSVLARIAAQDSMLAIRKAQEAIARHSGLLKVGTFEDAYMAENNSHGKAKNEFEQYDQEYLEPLRKWFNVMMKRLDGSYNNVTNYMIAKHGLERNAHMAFMAALEAEAKKAIGNTQPDAKRLRAQMVHDAYRQYKADSRRLINDADYEAGKYDYAQWRRTDDAIRKSYCSNYESFRYDKGGVVRDYAGLSSLFQNETDFEEKAAELCADIESKNGHETSELWDAVRQATRQILKNSHDAGMMSDETYDYVRGMYEHYIPLRGWNDSAADEVWDYAGGGRGVFNAALKEAHGRQSLADDPVAYIMNMAESGFLVNNRNWVKQHFLTMAMNHPTDLLTVSKAWYVKTKDQFGNEVWIPASPNIPVDETDPAVIEAALDAFQTKMEQMEQSGDATQQRGSLNIEYPQTKSEEREHEVRVMKDGEEYVVYVNGDPQLAQALNNTRAMRVREHEGLFEKACAWLGRKMAAVYTSLSPLFVPSNWARDTTMTLASTAIREDARYNWLLRTKFIRPDVQMRMFGLVKEYQNGKLREKVKSRTATKTEENFWNFMINGGETGFVSTMDVDAFREKIQRDLKDMGRTRLNPVKVGHTIADSVEYINRVIEDSNRFAIYQTSIEYGRGIEEAVQDAKNVTLNFNRKGTGEMDMSAIRQLYLFINPAIQSLQTLGALAKDHKAKFTAVSSAWMASGMLVPLFNELMFNLASAAAGGGGDDDDEFNPKDEYWKFSSFDRRNNCILWIPFTHNFIKIPLAPEFRGFYGIGDMVASAMWGGENAKESWSNYAADLMGQIIDLSPLDPVSYDGNVLVSLMPNAIRPLVEIAQNVTFTGKPIYRESDFNKYDPSFKKAYAGTPDFLLRYSKWMNSIGNKYPEAQQGPVEQTAVGRYANNPAVIDHLLKSYLGGMYTLGSQIAGAITKASDEETRKDFKTADIPFFSKFVANPNDRPQSKNKGDAYWQDFEKYQRTSHTLGVIRQDARKTGNFSVLEDFYKSEEYKEMKEYEPKAKQRKEEQKYERWKEEGNADLYQPHQQTGEDVYKRHSTPADDFEDTKASILYQKIRPAKDIFDLADINTPSGMDTFNKYYDLAGKVEEAHSVKKEMNAIVKSFVNDEHKTTFDPEKMKEYRALRKQYLQLVEDGNRMFEKIKAQRN